MSHLPAISLSLVSGPSAGQSLIVDNQPKTIGRGSGSDFVVADPTVSRLHVRLKPTPNGYVIENLAGNANVMVNDRLVSSSAPVRPGDMIRLGNAQFRVQLASGAEPTSGGSDETWVPRTVMAPEPDRTMMQPASPADYSDPTMAAVPQRQPLPPAAGGYTIVPGAPGAMIYPPQPQKNNQIWLYAMGALILVLVVIAGVLIYSRYFSSPEPPAVAVATPTETPSPIPTPSPTLTSTPIPAALSVPGLALAAAQEATAPQDAVNLVDPFCNSQLEIKADEPIFMGWEQRLAEPDGDIDYVAAWLDTAHYDVTLDGRPLPKLSFQRAGSTLKIWANLGLLAPGSHYLRIQQYSSRDVSTGLDVDPADGQVDLYAAGSIAEGFCELLAPEPTATSTSTPEPTEEPTVTPPPADTPVPTKAAPQPLAAAGPGIFQDFEANTNWKRGDQPNGTFTRASGQVHSGSYAGQLSYNFPTGNNDYVVFLQSRSLGGRPNALSAWVYGDGAGHFLNVWIKDGGGQTWQMSFGPVKHTGWQELTAFIDPGQPWPSGHISGPDNGAIEYPISFQALVLDDAPDSYSGSGTIYIDDLASKENAAPATPTPAPTPTAPPLAVQPPAVAQPPVQSPAVQPGNSAYLLQLGSQHRYEEPWGAPRGGDPCAAWRNDDWDDRNGNFRGFNVELILTNNSAFKVDDNWPESMSFITSSGQNVEACYYGYAGAGPAPNSRSSVTFFTVVPRGEFVQMMQLSLNGYQVRLCLDGRGGASYC